VIKINGGPLAELNRLIAAGDLLDDCTGLVGG
jgi:hypothetical protein